MADNTRLTFTSKAGDLPDDVRAWVVFQEVERLEPRAFHSFALIKIAVFTARGHFVTGSFCVLNISGPLAKRYSPLIFMKCNIFNKL